MWRVEARCSAVDVPEVLAELTAAFEAYERALTGNDIAALNDFFLDDPRTTRFGTREAERQYGADAIAAFRLQRGPLDQRRTLRNRRITTFGTEFGIANVEYVPAGSDRIGRQSQTWIRTEGGWKIVSAHVSFGTLDSALFANTGQADDLRPAWHFGAEKCIEAVGRPASRLDADLFKLVGHAQHRSRHGG